MSQTNDWLDRLNRMSNGYRAAIILLSAVRAGVFEALGDGQRTVTEVAGARGLDPRATDIVLCALTALGVVERDDDRFAIVDGARPYLLKDSPDTLVHIMGHNLNIMRKWLELPDVLRTGKPAPRTERTPEELRDFICGMENVSRRSSVDVAGKIDLSTARKLLDLGGGPGTAALTFARANPQLHCVVFDLADPVQIAREQIARASLADRVTTCAGDFLTDDYGHGFDVVYISNIIHMLGPEATLKLFEKSRAALETGGRILVKDFYLEDNRCEPLMPAVFSVNMLSTTDDGKSYTRSETLDLLRRAGFAEFAIVDVAAESQVVVGRAV